MLKKYENAFNENEISDNENFENKGYENKNFETDGILKSDEDLKSAEKNGKSEKIGKDGFLEKNEFSEKNGGFENEKPRKTESKDGLKNTPDNGKDALDGEKTFTQAQVDEIVKTRLARAMKNMPSKEETEQFYLSKQQMEENNALIENLKKEAQISAQKLLAYEHNDMINKRGVNEKFASFVRFEAEKNAGEKGDFSEALDNFINENPWVTQSTPLKTGLSQGNNIQRISSLEESFYRRNPNLR